MRKVQIRKTENVIKLFNRESLIQGVGEIKRDKENKRIKEVTQKVTVGDRCPGLRNKVKRLGLPIPKSPEKEPCAYRPAGTGISGAWRRSFRELRLSSPRRTQPGVGLSKDS